MSERRTSGESAKVRGIFALISLVTLMSPIAVGCDEDKMYLGDADADTDMDSDTDSDSDTDTDTATIETTPVTDGGTAERGFFIRDGKIIYMSEGLFGSTEEQEVFLYDIAARTTTRYPTRCPNEKCEAPWFRKAMSPVFGGDVYYYFCGFQNHDDCFIMNIYSADGVSGDVIGEIQTNLDAQFWSELGICADRLFWIEWLGDLGVVKVHDVNTGNEKIVANADKDIVTVEMIGDNLGFVTSNTGGMEKNDIFLHDLTINHTTAITADSVLQFDVALTDELVVWTDLRNGEVFNVAFFPGSYENADIYGYRIGSQDTFEITTADGDQEKPSAWDNLVCWTDLRHGTRDNPGGNFYDGAIYCKDLTTGIEKRISEPDGNSFRPMVWEGWVLYYRHPDGGISVTDKAHLYLAKVPLPLE